MNAKTQNMAGYGGYGGNEEFGEYSMNNFPEYSQTNAFLHTKYIALGKIINTLAELGIYVIAFPKLIHKIL